MKRWILHDFDRHDPLSEPRSVGVYEDDEGSNQAILVAIDALKIKSPRCLPIAFEEAKKVELLHAVCEGGEYMALFTSLDLAHCWIEYHCLVHPYLSYRQSFMVTPMLVPNGVKFPTAPKTVWQWLRNPAPYSFDAP